MPDRHSISHRRRAFCEVLLAGGALSVPGMTALAGVMPHPKVIGSGIALGEPDVHGLALPRGFTSRIIARSSTQVSGTEHIWHAAPDGGAVFSTDDGGWVYVSNSEISNGGGGAGALRFRVDGSIASAYSILGGTTRNCAGGSTPWGTWLSCEETAAGQVWECDPLGLVDPVAHPAMGWFNHEAVAVDEPGRALYLTEDRRDGRLYRYRPHSWPDLGGGILEVAEMTLDNGVIWHPIPEPNPQSGTTPTRHQVPHSTAFNGGEGIVCRGSAVYFTTKGDNRVWELDLEAQSIAVIYDRVTHGHPILSGVDNIAVAPGGQLVVAEDGGDMQLVALNQRNETVAIAQIAGHNRSELTGPAFSPDGSRLYVSSQRGPTGLSSDGVTYEIQGPFERLMFDGFEGIDP